MKTIIFDFDGTIANSLRLVVAIYRQLTGDKRHMSDEEFEALRHLPAQKIAKQVGVRFWQIPFLIRRGRKIMHARLDEVSAFPGLIEVLDELQGQGYTLRIVTSNSTENVREFLEKHDMNHYFVDVHGGVGLFNKANVLKRIVKKEQLDPTKTFYVGDEARDIVASKKAGLPIVSVTWGYNHSDLLRDMQPYALADKPQDLVTIFKDAA